MSRWGNFLSGIESGLDKILQEGEAGNEATKPSDKGSEKTDVSRASSTRRKPDRLQERLNKAIEGRQSGESTRAQSIARPPDAVKEEEVRSSIEQVHNKSGRPSLEQQPSGRPSLESQPTAEPDKALSDKPEPKDANDTQSTSPEEETSFERGPTETADTGDQFYLERIEALQAKLNLFIKEAADKAKNAQEAAESDTPARKAAQQDERIAELMAEGQKLSEKELKHVTTIRRLHTRSAETEASLNITRKAEAEAQREIKSLRSRVDTLQTAKRTTTGDEEARLQLQRQLEQAKKNGEAQSKEIAGLKSELDKAKGKQDLKELFEKQKQQLESEKRAVSDLREELENAKLEHELSTGRLKSQIDEQRSKTLQERERAAARTTELDAEVKTLESRLETMRSRREEETGTVGDQAKQLRQIEALQRQYSVSKENWSSVEASLDSRIASLEKERDALAKKETDLRRKLRETASNLRKRDDELEESMTSRQEAEDKLQSRRQREDSAMTDLKAALKKAQSEAEEAREEVKSVKASLVVQSENLTAVERLDEAAFSPNDRSHSPFASRYKSPASGYGDFKDRKQTSSYGLFPGNGVFPDRPPSSRKVSIASPHLSSGASFQNPPFRQHSFQSATRSSSRSAFRETNSIDDEHDISDGMRTPATPSRGFNDVLSASAMNPAAGPSVQLVERMSAAVRRLESEKTANRDELDRMSSERDEARKQIVALMEEVEAKRDAAEKIAKLEAQVNETSQRYQTTLELLGEKSETVEELKADIADMKQIYREALEKSVR